MTIQSPTKTVDVRALSHTREVIAYRNGGLFPVLTTTPDGTVIAVLRGGAGHLGLPGRIDIVRSLDGGQTWTYPNIVADSVRDDRNPGLGTSAKGTLILSYTTAGSYDAAGKYVPVKHEESENYWDMRITRSTDNGLTWDEPYRLTYPVLRPASPYGKMNTLPDGTILMSCYGRSDTGIPGSQAQPPAGAEGSSATYLLRSHDDGRTWGEPSMICPGSGEAGVKFLANGDLLAVVRRDGLWSVRSSDGGLNWSDPVQITGANLHPGDLVQLSDGSILLSHGDRNTPPASVAGMISRDNGQSWLDVRLNFAGRLRGYNADFPLHVDLGYPSSVLVPGSKPAFGITMYYYNPSIENRHDGILRNESAYSNVNYVAIAVVWREDELLDAVNKALH